MRLLLAMTCCLAVLTAPAWARAGAVTLCGTSPTDSFVRNAAGAIFGGTACHVFRLVP